MLMLCADNVDIQISSLEEEPGTFEPSYARRAPHTAAPVDDSFTAVQLSSEEETPSASLQRRLEQQLREELEAQHEQQRSS